QAGWTFEALPRWIQRSAKRTKPDPANRGRADLRGGAQAELFEPDAEVFEAGADARVENAKIGATNRQHATVEVLALELNRRGEPRDDLRVGIVDVVEAHQVDGKGARLVDGPAGALDEADLGVEIARQELV